MKLNELDEDGETDLLDFIDSRRVHDFAEKVTAIVNQRLNENKELKKVIA